jgi:GNAT superfamily N-acetyltransferase
VYRELAGPGEGEFRMLAVDPSARRRGLAKALVGRCRDRCRELGLDGLVLCTLEEMAPAHALYRSLGFRRDPGLDWEPAPGSGWWCSGTTCSRARSRRRLASRARIV